MNIIENDITENLQQHENIISLMEEAFPNSELLPISYIELMLRNGNSHFTAFYDKDIFVGISFVVTTDKTAFLFYLAVSDKVRAKGYGTNILAAIKNRYSDKVIILDVEWLDENAENIEQRIKRVDFYKRNGFNNTNLRLEWRDEYFDILATSKCFSHDDFIKILELFPLDLYAPKIMIM